ncbi:hypothetical protein M409DRAFT_70514 [Zasmidium cellare ATCC 36951]|uniref:LIP-domain-containing protein n=1 Tax=Zasmidium cellare ATCC 36951 TaxID=1080233 RepID=A0A6A6C0F0_ZASCE|nr:uncharacterized protein M409DRAFT_70514 [Zasmidium cellare ATCC 36951]KAF2160353.1 hypothetical protein M409DRAFT_70514 [Zasmidium cellare ATCC 36951]
MLNIKSIVSIAAAVLPLVSARPASLGTRAVLLPEDDPFYQAPITIDSSAPGTVLKSRKVATSFFGFIPNPVEAWQLLYRTNAVNGTAISAVTTVFVPTGAKTDRFVSFHTAYDGSSRDGKCDPSYNYQLGAPQEDIISSVEFLLLQAFLIDGYIVSAPDYEGPDAAFGAGRLEGTGVLDSIRAVQNFGSTLGLTTTTPAVVGYGYSGGAIATGWAAGLQPTYAPELNIKGWAQGGTPANLTGTTVFIDGTAFSGFLPQALVGLSSPSAYGATLEPKIDSIVTTEGASQIAFAEANCGVANLLQFPFKSVQSIEFQTEGDRILYDPVLAYALDQQLMGRFSNETPTAPVYLFHATSDEIIPYANASTLYNEWCGYGASVDFVTYANGGHATTEVLGFPGAFEFVNSAFAGTVASGCSQQTKLDSTLNPIALGAQLEPILVALLNALAAAGTQDANIKADVSNFAKTIT